MFCVLWISRQVYSIRATAELNRSQRRESRRLFPQMVSAAHPCRHLWPWNMAGIKLMYFVSFKIMSVCPRFVVVGGTPMLLLCLCRWNDVSGRWSWSLTWGDSPQQNPFPFLLSKYACHPFSTVLHSRTRLGLNSRSHKDRLTYLWYIYVRLLFY